jgi:hypothetical protein
MIFKSFLYTGTQYQRRVHGFRESTGRLYPNEQD